MDGESKRGRVRRLLIDPLESHGFRRAASVTVEKHRAVIDQMCDHLAYASDRTLAALRDLMRFKGEGAKRDVWPAAASFYSFAEAIEPAPIEELPGLLRWFQSIEGPRALHDQTLVETWAFWHKYKRPPLGMRARLMAEARDNRLQMDHLRAKIERGVATSSDVSWVKSYEDRLTYCTSVVRARDKSEGEAA